jgi:hypothetical protein
MKKKVKERMIRQFADQLVGLMQTKTTDELKTIIDECEQLTSTNCWWVEYHMKDLLSELAQNEIRLRADRAEAKPTP